MRRASRLVEIIFVALLLVSSSLHLAWGSSLTVGIATNKLSYVVGDPIVINGSLSLNTQPVSDGVVAVQVNDPKGGLFALRALSTGAGAVGSWPVEIQSVTPVADSSGNPVSVLPAGSYVGFNVTVRNNDLFTHSVTVAVSLCFSNQVPFGFQILYNGSLEGSRTISIVSYPLIRIPVDAPLGNSTVFASILSPTLPKEGGYAFAPEKTGEFMIANSTLGQSAGQQITRNTQTSTNGTFSMTFATPTRDAKLGDYTIYAASFYPSGVYPYFASTMKTFKVALFNGDLDGDGKIDIKDLSIAAAAFGSSPGSSNWNPAADINGDLKVDIRDLALIAMNFGKTPYTASSGSVFACAPTPHTRSLTSTTPWFEVSPTSILIGPDLSVNKAFNLTVNVVNLDTSMRVVGFEFDLSFNSSLAKIAGIENGSLFNDPSWNMHGSFFKGSIEENGTLGKISVTGMLLPNMSDQWDVFPEGNGTVASIQFMVLKQSWSETYISDLALTKAVLVDETGLEVFADVPQNGLLVIQPYGTVGRSVDVWIGGYPPPYGGQGANMSADVVVPQQTITLIARVTYNGWPVAQKTVLFEIRDNMGTLAGLLSATTNSTGYASVAFRMPWPDVNPEGLLGVWKVTASVDIAGLIASDILQYRYDYILQIWNVETDKLQYNHLDSVQTKVTFETNVQTPREVWFRLLIVDNLGVIVGTVTVTGTVGGANLGYHKDYTFVVSAIIPSTTFDGASTLRVDFLNKPPNEGGVPITPEVTKVIYILPL